MITSGNLIVWSALALLGRIFWNYLPMAIDAVLDGEITLGELRSFLAYLIRADAGQADYFSGMEPAPFKPACGDPYVGERDS